MAPSFENLPEDNGYDSEEELDLSGLLVNAPLHLNANQSTDLREQYDVRLEQGLDAFVIIDGLPVVPEESKQKLIKFLLKKLNSVGRTKEDNIFMPLNDNGMSEG